MSNYKYSEIEKQINIVLKHHRNSLESISFPDTEVLDSAIAKSEELLRARGVELPNRSALQAMDEPQRIMVLPSWETLCKEAEASVGCDVSLEDLFSAEELRLNEEAIRKLNEEYNQIHRLDKNDIAIAAVAGMLGAIVDILLVGMPQKTPEGLQGGVLANYVRDYFEKKYPEQEMNALANSKVSKVPYDAQDNRNTIEYVEGLSSYYHRLLSLGHDPLLGLIIGVADILTGRMTTIDKDGKIVSQVIAEYTDRSEQNIFLAIAKQIAHFKSDINTSMGLPAPLMALFNLLQFGDFGDENQTIAEIVQGMYYEGYDFVHFCTLSIPVMIIEVITRVGYAIKRIKEGYSIKEAIPVTSNHEKHPKLGTMLFVGHSAAVAANAGKIYFTKNPMALNYPQWVAFGKYSYQQLKWTLLQKPEARDAYVRNIINEQTATAIETVNETFDIFSQNYIVVME